MSLLIAGILLFTGTHLFLSLAPGKVELAKQRIGAGGVKALLSVLSIAGLALLVFGWRSSDPTWLYSAPANVRSFALGLIVLALYLFVVSNRPSAVKRIVRHPQLSGVLLWATAHLLLNGDTRSLLLFGGMAFWAVLEILLINRREGAWEKPPAPSLVTELMTVIAALVFVAFVAWAHPWLAGVPAIAGL
ncbi:NnrU family protein [Congregibacter variabilis]|uniref:NnrU family protein n=1 Tax=Congregibacter variabilis TaxID=3081200 RepID=A0ABZ0I4A6_9GAMM|nr:NnrU family protein [Congregibacter sp. IMCC43200]